MIPINNVEEFEVLLEKIDWHDSFFREFYVQSPSYLTEDGGEVAPDAKWGAKLFIILFDDLFKGIEFYFKEARCVSIEHGYDIEPQIEFSKGYYRFQLSAYAYPIVAQKVSYRLYTDITEVQGYKTLYGKERFFDKEGIDFDELFPA